MQIDTKEFEDKLCNHRTLKARYGPDIRQSAANAIISMMRECMSPILYEMGPIRATDLATVRRFYQIQHERLREVDDKLAAGQMSANAEILTAIANDNNIPLNYMPESIDSNRLTEMLNNRPIMRPIDYDRILEPVGFEGRGKGGDPAKTGISVPAAETHLARVARTPKPMPKQSARRAEPPKRPLEEIRADYEATWRQIEAVCQIGEVKVPLITLTDVESRSPWLRMEPDKAKDKIEATRKTAKDFLNKPEAEKVSELLNRVAKLHAEHQAAKGTGRGKFNSA